MKRTSKFHRAGMTLLELVAAVAVLAIVTTELLVLRSQAMEVAADARNTRISKELARQKMEEYLVYYENIPEEGSGAVFSLEIPVMEPTEFKDHPGFYWEIEEETQDFDVLLPEEEEETDPEAEEEENLPHNMVFVTITIFRVENRDMDNRQVMIVLQTLREETSNEQAESQY